MVRSNTSGACRDDVDEWERLIREGGDDKLRAAALDPSPHGISMRQDNPFLGIMTERDRLKVIKDAYDAERAIRASASLHKSHS
ncbi:hypothetical protein BSD967_10605 [Bifidobacterium saguini]|uniref:Uncharacterized protein n=1 Tax=Bifidobacterium saguini TaxID=762210 RepID=A0ABX7SCU8_9BIFI|nr:hypothetical protein [Bifidobacterium saguini]QTB90723.1 hypothetical protein BSD967_10605 [Bifidobacterium saguini]